MFRVAADVMRASVCDDSKTEPSISCNSLVDTHLAFLHGRDGDMKRRKPYTLSEQYASGQQRISCYGAATGYN